MLSYKTIRPDTLELLKRLMAEPFFYKIIKQPTYLHKNAGKCDGCRVFVTSKHT